MLGDIDLIFGIWMYNDELQIKFTFSSGPMIFGQLTAVELCNLVLSEYSSLKFGQIFSWRHFFYTMIWDIDLIFGIWVHSDELPIKFEFRSEWMIFGLIYAPWTFNFGQIYSFHHFISLCFEILTWFLIFGITMMSYRSSFIRIGRAIHMQVL